MKIKDFLKIEINPNRIFGLDLLRAFAILFVVFGHGRGLLPVELSNPQRFFIFDGVTIFFVLSGFLIGGILIKIVEKNKPSKALLVDFWIRRWFRTLPNYFLVLLILVGLSLVLNDNFTLLSVNRFFIFSQNLFSPHPSWFFPEAWSLSVEEWFYLITPVLLLLTIKYLVNVPKKAIFLVVFLILIATLLFRYYRYSELGITTMEEWDEFFRKQVFTRLDSLMFGFLGAYLNYYFQEKWIAYKNYFLVLGIALFVSIKAIELSLVFPIAGFYECVFSFSVTSMATLFLLPYLSNLKSGKGFAAKGITVISLISYSLYLIHLSIVQTFIIFRIDWEHLIRNEYTMKLVMYFTYWLISILGSIILFKYFETPTMKWRDNEKVKKAIARLNNKG
ncbi:MAG: acyltransferase [Bacteroidia bacterium]